MNAGREVDPATKGVVGVNVVEMPAIASEVSTHAAMNAQRIRRTGRREEAGAGKERMENREIQRGDRDGEERLRGVLPLGEGTL